MKNARVSLSISVAAMLASVLALSAPAQAAGEASKAARPSIRDNLSRSMEAEAGTIRKDPAADGEQDGIKPSGGVDVFERMGAALPALPPEKPFTGTIDEAYGHFQRGEYLKALDKALTRAEKGDAIAQTLVGEITSRGLGIAANIKDAAFWFGQAAEGGDPHGMYKYAMLLLEGRGVERNKEKADDFMRRAAEGGNASAQFNWAQILVTKTRGPDGLREALPFYEKAAEQGIADAQYATAQIYHALTGIEPEKKNKIREYMQRAAKAGYDSAQVDLGIWLINGTAGEKDYDEGFRWLKKAADSGNVVAQNKLSHLYIQALGTRADPIEAVKWYVLSRRAGLKDPALEDYYLGVNEEHQLKGIEAANRFRPA